MRPGRSRVAADGWLKWAIPLQDIGLALMTRSRLALGSPVKITRLCAWPYRRRRPTCGPKTASRPNNDGPRRAIREPYACLPQMGV